MYFMVYLYGWFYRLRQDGMVEASQEVGDGEEWLSRSGEAVNLTGSEMWAVKETLKLGSAHFPVNRVAPPVARPVEAERETSGADVR